MYALIQQKNLFRERKIKPAGLCFSSNDYLDLVQDREVIQAFCEGACEYGLGSTGSALVSGYTKAHARLEAAFADYVSRDRALLFSNGYMANAAVLQAVLGRKDIVFQDKLNHASLLDGAQLSHADQKRYRHLDIDHLEALLKTTQASKKLIVTDHVFSMTGEIAPVPSLIKLAHQHQSLLIIDNAHGLGVIDFPYSQAEVPLLVCPLGKAFGGSGALVAGPHDLIETLIQFARPYLFSTALSPALAHALQKSLEIIETQTWRRKKLLSNIAYFKKVALQKRLPILKSATGIQMLQIGDDLKAQALSDALYKRRLIVRAVRPPSVPIGQAGLRITLSCKHEQAEIDFLLSQLESLL